MDSDENHFNVLFVAKDTVTITIKHDSVSPYTTTLQSQITSSDPEHTPAVTRHCRMSFGYFWPRHTPNTSDPPLPDVFWYH